MRAAEIITASVLGLLGGPEAGGGRAVQAAGELRRDRRRAGTDRREAACGN